MTYTKPELVTLGIAVSVIQGTKECPNIIEGAFNRTFTPGAYEADE